MPRPRRPHPHPDTSISLPFGAFEFQVTFPSKFKRVQCRESSVSARDSKQTNRSLIRTEFPTSKCNKYLRRTQHPVFSKRWKCLQLLPILIAFHVHDDEDLNEMKCGGKISSLVPCHLVSNISHVCHARIFSIICIIVEDDVCAHTAVVGNTAQNSTATRRGRRADVDKEIFKFLSRLQLASRSVIYERRARCRVGNCDKCS